MTTPAAHATNIDQRENTKGGVHVAFSPNSVSVTSFDASGSSAQGKLVPLIEERLQVPPLYSPRQHKSQQLPCAPPMSPPQHKLPPRSPISKQRPRSASEGDAFGGGRRSIFGKYWSNSSKNSSNQQTITEDDTNTRANTSVENHRVPVPSPPQRVRKRSSSLSILDYSNQPVETKDYRMFAPPKEHAHRSVICSRFSSVDAVPELSDLPPLPAPLRRLCSEDSATRSLHGMYPLLTPIPILRQSSYGPGQGNEKIPTGDYDTVNNNGSFNLTRSYRATEAGVMPMHMQSTSSSSNSDGSAAAKTSLKFDPRVTVTEFEDPVERLWFNEDELMRLKQETVILAQEYLMTHPDEADKYSRVKWDPVAGAYRKKALFSLPVLSAWDGSPEDNAESIQNLLENQVRKILIVDPNAAILNLFCKSMKSMFPNAELTTTQCRDDAVGIVSRQLQTNYGSIQQNCRNFDIIIVEQCLRRHLQGGKLRRHHVQQKVPATMSKYKSFIDVATTTTTSKAASTSQPLRKPNSFAGRTSPLTLSASAVVSGADLMRKIQEMEAAAMSLRLFQRSHKSFSSCGSSLKPLQWRALLIGVSIHPDRDTEILKDAGADIVWGKPIPRIGDSLRNGLLNSLLSKRNIPRELCEPAAVDG